MLRTLLIAVILLGIAAPGCSPLNASTAIREAEVALVKAEEQGAPEHAKYEYWMAREYLRKAKLTEGYSEFQIATQYATRSQGYANQAVKSARDNREKLKIIEQNKKLRANPAGATP